MIVYVRKKIKYKYKSIKVMKLFELLYTYCSLVCTTFPYMKLPQVAVAWHFFVSIGIGTSKNISSTWSSEYRLPMYQGND